MQVVCLFVLILCSFHTLRFPGSLAHWLPARDGQWEAQSGLGVDQAFATRCSLLQAALPAAAVSPPWFQLPAASSSWAPRLVHTVSFLLPLWPQGEWPLLAVAGLWVASPCPTGFSALLTSLSPVVCVKFRLLNHHSVGFVFPSGTPQFGHPQRKWGGAMPSPGRRRPWPGWGPSSS